MGVLVDDSFSFFGSSLLASQPLSIRFSQKLLKYVRTVPRAPVILLLIGPDALHSQTTFHDVKAEALYFWQDPCYTDIAITNRPKSYICDESLIIQN